MIASGERLDLGGLSRPTVDKHSTGGVGDKISLILAPLVGACGACVPQLSGRGLGHTGGTLDKLESIPGWRASLSNDEIRSQLESVGAVVCAAGAGLAPVDRRLYALRDVTATVESVPLIASSIMSKKIAEGTDALVLDVKVGRGAFIKDLARARELASTMVGLGASHGVATVAQLTAMDAPLGRAVGNAIEVNESVDVLKGAGPSDVRELTLALARIMLELVGLSVDPATRLDDGSAYEVYCRMIRAQGGDPDAVLALGAARETIVASESGTVQSIDALAVGRAAWHLGAGRARKEDAVSAGAGVLCLVVTGDRVSAGQPLFELLADDEDHLESGRAAIANALVVGSSSSAPAPLLIERVDS
jgi:thymidine phosphorylase